MLGRETVGQTSTDAQRATAATLHRVLLARSVHLCKAASPAPFRALVFSASPEALLSASEASVLAVARWYLTMPPLAPTTHTRLAAALPWVSQRASSLAACARVLWHTRPQSQVLLTGGTEELHSWGEGLQSAGRRPPPAAQPPHTHCHTALGVCTHAAAAQGASSGAGRRRMVKR